MDITIGTTLITSGTDTRVLFDDNGVVGEDAGLVYDKTTDGLTIGTATTAGVSKTTIANAMSGSSTTSNFFNVTGTTPTTLAAAGRAINFQITGAGSSAQNVTGLGVDLLAGHTGTGVMTSAISGTSVSAGVNVLPFSNQANFGVFGSSVSNPTGATWNIGVGGVAQNNGTSGRAAGGFFRATDTTSTWNVGVFASALSGTSFNNAILAQIGNSIPVATAGAVIINNGTAAVPILVCQDNATAMFTIANGGKVSVFNGVTTTGWGLPGIYGTGRSTAQTAAVASVATYTVGAADGSFDVSMNVNVTTSTTHSFTVECAYTDETNTARVMTFPLVQLAGTFITAITNVTGVGPYESPVMHIRCKAATAITLQTQAAGTYTTVTYNVEGIIKQTA